MSSALAQQVKEMQKRVAQLEEERLAAQSRTDVEKELQIQVLGTSFVSVCWDNNFDRMEIVSEYKIMYLNWGVEALDVCANAIH